MFQPGLNLKLEPQSNRLTLQSMHCMLEGSLHLLLQVHHTQQVKPHQQSSASDTCHTD